MFIGHTPRLNVGSSARNRRIAERATKNLALAELSDTSDFMRATTDRKRLHLADINRMNDLPEEIRLTADQRQFVHDHHGVYSERPHETVRWIVNDHGLVLERDAFKRDRAA
jgi:hypothetical protein